MAYILYMPQPTEEISKMGKMGTLTLDKWGPFSPVHDSCASKGPWYYINTEGIIIDFETDEDAARSLMPPDLELVEPATAFVSIVDNHWTTLGPYGEAYMGIMCKWQGEVCCYIPAVYTTGVASRVVAREIVGCGKKTAERIEVTQHADGDIQAIMEIKNGDRAACVVMRPATTEPIEALGAHQSIPMIFLKTFPDPEGGDRPALAQLISQPYPVHPHVDAQGRAMVYSGPGHLAFGWPSDLQLPIRGVPSFKFSRYDSVLEYPKILKTYTPEEFEAAEAEASAGNVQAIRAIR